MCITYRCLKGQTTRKIKIESFGITKKSLGLALGWSAIGPTLEGVYHVLDVATRSPAQSSGLRPQEDYIVGTPEGFVRGESGLSELIEDVTL